MHDCLRSGEFPDKAWWQANVVHPSETVKFGKTAFYENYRRKFDVVREVRPEALSICEIGVRWGYSAFSFMCALPKASYHGIDRLNEHGQAKPTHGGVFADTFTYVRKMLEGRSVALTHADSQDLNRLPGGPFDLIHVDGDHFFEGAAHDLELALQALSGTGMILVDDYDYIASVRSAVSAFLHKHKWEIEGRYFKSLRGEMVMVRREKPETGGLT